MYVCVCVLVEKQNERVIDVREKEKRATKIRLTPIAQTECGKCPSGSVQRSKKKRPQKTKGGRQKNYIINSFSLHKS